MRARSSSRCAQGKKRVRARKNLRRKKSVQRKSLNWQRVRQLVFDMTALSKFLRRTGGAESSRFRQVDRRAQPEEGAFDWNKRKCKQARGRASKLDYNEKRRKQLHKQL